MGPIFIGGCDRSGTTLMRLMLIQSPDLHIPGETTFVPVMRACAEEYGDFTQPEQSWFFVRDLMRFQATTRNTAFEVFELTPGEAHEAVSAAAPTDYAGAAAAVFAACAQKKGKQRWGDKSPGNVMHMDYLGEAYPDAKFIHMIRDARDVTRSIRKAGWMHNYRVAAQTWVLRIETGQRVGAQLGPERYREVHYETLVQDTEKELRNLCDWLELAYVPEMLEFHRESMDNLPQQVQHLFDLAKKPADASRAGAWRKDMPRKHIADVEAEAGPVLQKLGYELTGARPSPLIRLVRGFFDWLRPRAMRGLEYVKRLG